MSVIADEKIIYRSEDPQNLYCYTPHIAQGFDGRLLLSFDIAGKGLKNIPGPKSDHGDFGSNQCKIYISDDDGISWEHSFDLPMLHARIFKAGAALYIIGHSGRLVISKSMDNGVSWSNPAVLEDDHFWHQSAGTIDYRHGKVYLTMEHEPYPGERWAGGDPVLLCAKEVDDLTIAVNWTFSNKMEFAQTVPQEPNLFGLKTNCWLESSVVRVYDPSHELYDPEDRTVLLLLRLSGNRTNHFAGILAGKEGADGSLTLEPVKDADNNPIHYVPFPGGYMKFHICYDVQTRLYWLVTSQPVFSSFCSKLPENYREERRRLELFYSKNLFDWCSAGIIAVGPCETGARHYASLMINKEDILVLSRSGDEKAKDAHDTNLITLHRVKNFRSLVL